MDLEGDIDKEYAQRVDVKRQWLDLQEDCRPKKEKLPLKVAKAAELAQKLLRSSDTPVGVVLLSESPGITGEDTVALFKEVKRPKASIAESESVETLTSCWYQELMGEAKQRCTEEVSVLEEIS